MALTRNPDWISGLEDSEVFVNFADETPHIGRMGLIGANWHTLGVLTEEGTVGLTRGLTENVVNGMGYGVVARSHTPGAVSSTADVLEENDVTRYIEWPDAEYVEGVRIKKHTAKVARGHVAVVRVRENGIVTIEASRYPAYLTIAEQGRGRDAAGKQVAIGYEIGPDKDVLEERHFKVDSTTGEVTELDPKIFVDDASIAGTVEDGTAKQIASAGGEEVSFEDPANPQ